MTRSGPRAGFTLVEALAAFAIVAAASLALHRGLVQARLGGDRAEARAAAVWVARGLLSEPLSTDDVVNGGREGLADGLRYAVRVTPLELPPVEPPEDGAPAPGAAPRDTARTPPAWRPARVRVTVEAATGPPVAVDTVRLVPDRAAGAAQSASPR